MRPQSLAFLVSLAGVLPVSAQVLTFAEGSPGALTIFSVPESNPAAPDLVVLQDAELLPIEITGRTLAMENEVARSRRVDRQGIARVELPQGGRLFRYRRQAGAFWGFLLVRPDGAASVVLELAGTGATLDDPFADRIGVAADGQHAVVPRLSGGAYVVRLDGSTFASTGLPNRLAVAGNFEVEPLSVMVGPTAFFCQAKDSGDVVLRCGLGDLANPVDVSPATIAGAHYKPTMTLAGDGSRAAYVYGPVQNARIYQVGLTGTSGVLPPPPSKYEAPNYLPEGPGEASLLLDETGQRLFYVDALVRDELFLLDTNGVLPTLQITEDGWFQPYIGLHILPKFGGTRLVMAIGDASAMDFFAAQLDAAGGTVQNLTNTGTVSAPFGAGTLSPTSSLPAGGDLLVTDQTPSGLTLRRVDPTVGGLVTLQTGLLGLPEAGGALPGEVSDPVVGSTLGTQLRSGATGSLLVTLPAGLTMTPPVQGPLFAATWLELAGGFGAVFAYGAFGLVSGPLEVGVTQVAVTPLGGLVIVGSPVRYFAGAAGAVLNRPAATVRLFLAGA